MLDIEACAYPSKLSWNSYRVKRRRHDAVQEDV